jgi:L-ascorbate metabolism protein UlaG (beta-lactamase superfamily)
MKLQLLRNATQILVINNKTILIDPMLASKDSYEAFQNTDNTVRNPLVDLPVSDDVLKQLIVHVDAVLLTHIHLDHWDPAAQQLLPKDVQVFCQSVNVEVIKNAGFIKITAINDELVWNDITIHRTGGHHGTGEIGERMGIVSGYVITHQDESLYFAGDTIWCDEVAQALDKFNPDHIVLNGGGARFIAGDPIIMDIQDVLKVCSYAPKAKVYVVHLESVNHAKESRSDIKVAIKANDFTDRCCVPDDGEWFI